MVTRTKPVRNHTRLSRRRTSEAIAALWTTFAVTWPRRDAALHYIQFEKLDPEAKVPRQCAGEELLFACPAGRRPRVAPCPAEVRQELLVVT